MGPPLLTNYAALRSPDGEHAFRSVARRVSKKRQAFFRSKTGIRVREVDG